MLLVDDERLIRWSLRQRLEPEGYRILEAATGAEAMRLVEDGVDLVLLDNRLPDGEGVDLLPKMRRINPDIVVIMLTGHSSVEHAVLAIKAGAWHYARKPLDLDEVALLVQKGLETTQLRSQVKNLRAAASQPFGPDSVIGESTAIKAARVMLQKIARTPATTILLGGESGTGKDLAAKVIHYSSERAEKPFMNITCSALQETLLESELFGHEKGAFTDAKTQKKGLLEMADGGTVFLDEIGEMSLSLQSKMLRFLEEKSFKRVGSSRDIRVDVRVIAATNRDLEAEVQSGRFREDLYYRLRVLPVVLPPLRQRTGDIPILADYFCVRFAKEFHKNVRGIDDEARHMLEAHRWPGNVRELKNAVERAVLLADGDKLTTDDFLMVAPPNPSKERLLALPATGLDLDSLERDLVEQAIERTRGNQTHAAQLLGLSRDQMRYRLEKLGIVAGKSRAGDLA